MNAGSRKNILIFDSERDTGEFFARALESRRNCRCYLASSVEEALDLLRGIPFALMILDLKSAMADDFHLLKQIRKTSPETIIIVDGYLHQKDQILKTLSLGAHGHIIKPIQLDAFRKKIEEYTLDPTSSAGDTSVTQEFHFIPSKQLPARISHSPGHSKEAIPEHCSEDCDSWHTHCSNG